MDGRPVNDWSRIRAFYAQALPMIMSEERCEWAIDPYEWDNGMLRMTMIEQWLWSDIRACGAIFYPQFPVGGVFVDFANPAAKVAIECDGKAFHRDEAKDAARDAKLRGLGWTVYRISGSDCRTEADPEAGKVGVAYQFVKQITERHRIGRHHIGMVRA